MFNQEAKLLANGYKVEDDLLVKMDGGMCTGVYHIGKYPQVFRYHNGHVVRYRNFSVHLKNPIKEFLFHANYWFSEVKYAIKSYFAVKSGFVEWQSKFSDSGGFYWETADFDYDDPYYVCAKFGNGRHIPLPILGDWEDENKLQKLAIKLAGGFDEDIISPEEAYQ